MNRQASKTDPLGNSESYSYATNGLIAQLVDRKGQTIDTTYDARNRVTYYEGDTPIGTLTYAYDAAGHLVSKGGTLASVALPAAVASATYNADNQLTLWGSQGFLYDLNGNMTADGNNAYQWNVRNQLVGLTPDGGTASTFVYDALGRRGLTHPDVFSRVAEISPSTWWDSDWIATQVQGTGASRPAIVYVDSGQGSVDDDSDTDLLASAYLALGYVDGVSFRHVIQPGASHSEVYWAQRFPGAMQLLLGER